MKPLTPNTLLKRSPGFVKKQAARFAKAKAKSRKRAATVSVKDLPALTELRDSLVDRLNKPIRYFIAFDDWGYDYIVPADRRADWEIWLLHSASPSAAEQCAPEWATRIDGISSITFVDWRQENS